MELHEIEMKLSRHDIGIPRRGEGEQSLDTRHRSTTNEGRSARDSVGKVCKWRWKIRTLSRRFKCSVQFVWVDERIE